MREEKNIDLREKMIAVTIIFAVNWIRAVLLWKYNSHLLSGGESFLRFANPAIFIILCFALMCFLIKNTKKKYEKKTIIVRNRLLIAISSFVMQWIWSIPSILGDVFGEFFWRYNNYIIYSCYGILLLFIWIIAGRYFFKEKKKTEYEEERRGENYSAWNKAGNATFLLTIQFLVYFLNTYWGMWMAFIYPLVILVIGIVLLLSKWFEKKVGRESLQ